MKRIFLITLGFLFCGFFSFSKGTEPVTKVVLGVHNEREVCLYTLTNRSGNVLKLTNYGARIERIEVPDKNGVKDNVTLGAETFESIIRGDAFGGATVGRFANRIAKGKFTLDGTEYSLPINNRPNTLHGGSKGWYSQVWSSEILKGKQPAVKFTYLSPDMEEGFPGNVTMSVTFRWSDKNEIIIDYEATTDKKTVLNITNHAYFNLHGVGKGPIFDHLLTLRANAYTPVNSTQIPTGEIRQVKGTPFDFTTSKNIGSYIGEKYDSATVGGYDHNFVLDPKYKICATVYDFQSGRILEVETSEPGMQFYSGNGLSWKKAVDAGTPYSNARSGFALETQHYPDSPNQSTFPTTVLKPGTKFKSRTIYRFSVKK